jgi:hypothetical protein
MSKEDYRIWSNADLDYEEWKDWMEEEYPTLSDDERVAMMYEENGHYLEDERLNLDIQLSQTLSVSPAGLAMRSGRCMAGAFQPGRESEVRHDEPPREGEKVFER